MFLIMYQKIFKVDIIIFPAIRLLLRQVYGLFFTIQIYKFCTWTNNLLSVNVVGES